MRPAKNDYDPYYETYISKIVQDNPVEAMVLSKEETVRFFSKLKNEAADQPYAEGKWTYKEALGHIIDSERVMAYRALCIARGETKPLPGFDQDIYAAGGNFNKRNITALLAEYSIVRESSLFLFNNFGNYELNKRGVANENEVTVLALGYIIAGHNIHHLEILKSNYHKNL